MLRKLRLVHFTRCVERRWLGTSAVPFDAAQLRELGDLETLARLFGHATGNN